MAHQDTLFPDDDDDDVAVRVAWRRLVDQTLPRAARAHPDWPVFRNHCFARILLDNACGIMWREAIEPPAWRNTPAPVLQTAIDLGESVLNGEADLWALNDRSLILRDKKPHGKKPAARRTPFKPSDSRHGRAAQARQFKTD